MEPQKNQAMSDNLIAITQQLLAESGQPYQRNIRMDSSLQHQLGIDSIARAELFHRIEKAFHVHIPDKLLSEAETLNDIAIYLQTADLHVQPPKLQMVQHSHSNKSVDDMRKANTLNDVLIRYAEQVPDQAHLYFQNEQGQEEVITYRALLSSSLHVANGLRERGLRPVATDRCEYQRRSGLLSRLAQSLLEPKIDAMPRDRHDAGGPLAVAGIEQPQIGALAQPKHIAEIVRPVVGDAQGQARGQTFLDMEPVYVHRPPRLYRHATQS